MSEGHYSVGIQLSSVLCYYYGDIHMVLRYQVYCVIPTEILTWCSGVQYTVLFLRRHSHDIHRMQCRCPDRLLWCWFMSSATLVLDCPFVFPYIPSDGRDTSFITENNTMQRLCGAAASLEDCSAILKELSKQNKYCRITLI